MAGSKVCGSAGMANVIVFPPLVGAAAAGAGAAAVVGFAAGAVVAAAAGAPAVVGFAAAAGGAVGVAVGGAWQATTTVERTTAEASDIQRLTCNRFCITPCLSSRFYGTTTG